MLHLCKNSIFNCFKRVIELRLIFDVNYVTKLHVKLTL